MFQIYRHIHEAEDRGRRGRKEEGSEYRRNRVEISQLLDQV